MNSPYIRSELAKAALRQVPALIRNDLLADPNFVEEYGFGDGTVLSFGEFGVSLRRSDLFNAVRIAISSSTVTEVADTEGQMWQVKNICDAEELPKLEVSKENKGFILPDLSVLSSDANVRLRSLDHAISDINLPVTSGEMWRNILSERELKDFEVDLFLNDIHDTPTEIARSVHNGFLNKHIDIPTMIPLSVRYYERLVGVYDGSANISEYAAKKCKMIFNQLSSWHTREGFLLSLLLAIHSSISDQIDVSRLSDKEFIDCLIFVEKSGDRISQLGAVEIGLRVVQSKPDIKPYLTRLIKLIFSDEVDQPNSGFKLLSALFRMVDGELSRARLLTSAPPFYRRLAAFSQAALIQRQIQNSDIDINHFCEWVSSNDHGRFYIQSLVDMRLEPRWNPDFAVAMQLKADFLGRLMNTVTRFSQEAGNNELLNLIDPSTFESFDLQVDLFRLYLPGPLEGNIESLINTPPEMKDVIQAQLNGEQVSPASFIALVNSALLFQVDTNQAELAAKTLNLGNHRLEKVDEKAQLVAILNGLAMVAAVSGSSLLTDNLRILVRRYRQDAQFLLSVEESIRICLMASACYADLITWRDYVGDWLTEFAFSDLTDEEGNNLYSYLHYLLQIAPDLWTSCGRAEAATKAFIACRVV